MARKKQVDDEELIEIISEYFILVCKKNPNKLKKPDIARYVESKGYQGYSVRTLRRNQVACDYIESLKGKSDDTIAECGAYQTLDIEGFIRTNSTPNSLRRALGQLDIRIKTLCDTVNMLLAQKKDLTSQLYDQEKRMLELSELGSNAVSSDKESKEIIKELTEKNEYLTVIVNDYIYPDLANELLGETNLRNVDTIISDFKALRKTDNIISIKKSIINRMDDDF